MPKRRAPLVLRVDVYLLLMELEPSDGDQMEVDESEPVQMEINKLEMGNVMVQLNKAMARYRQLKAECKQEQEEKEERAYNA